MAFLFGRNKQRGATDLCRTTRDLLNKLNSDEPTPPKIEEDLAKNLAQMKLTVQGTPEQEVSQPAVHQLVESLAAEDVLYPLSLSFPRLNFDSRKDAQTLLCSVFRFRVPLSPSSNHPSQNQPLPENDPLITSHVVNDRPEIIPTLCRGYERRESAMPCGNVLREAMKHDSLAALIFYDEPVPDGQRSEGLKKVDPRVEASGRGVFWRFFEWIDKSAFEVGADAFTTFAELLKKHKKLTSHYLLTNYTLFTTTYNNTLIRSPSYVTKRQSIKLLAELLLERSNYTLMTRYIASAANLKLSMQLLRDDARMVAYEAFHIFKVFVANPNKSEEVRRIFVMNRERLLRFLPGFLGEREEDAQFLDERAYCVRMIEGLPSLEKPPGTVGTGAEGEQGQGAVAPGGMSTAAGGRGGRGPPSGPSAPQSQAQMQAQQRQGGQNG